LLDKNGDGVVDKEELVALLEKNMHVEHNRALGVTMFKVLDEDHDGLLSRKELAKLVT
jgi:Ca2+-binding EF-hand superfamily protein|tara:strand:+ start:477 stop:650 length:174 start_codon:yes stop_codon:yes gene_type:complete